MNHPTERQWTRDIESLRRILDTLQSAGIELFDRDRHTAQPDGYPTSSMGGDGRGGSTGSSTENAALAEPRRDQVHLDALGLRHNMLRMVEYANAALGCVQHAKQVSEDKPADHGPSGACVVCDRRVEGTAEDRLRRGMCHADYTAWVRAGRPDIGDFKRDRKSEAA